MSQVNSKIGDNMSSGSMKLNRNLFNSGKLIINKHALSMEERISYPTVLKYLDKSEDVDSFKGDVLYSLLVVGMGYSLEEVRNLTLGEVFDISSKKVAV